MQQYASVVSVHFIFHVFTSVTTATVIILSFPFIPKALFELLLYSIPSS